MKYHSNQRKQNIGKREGAKRPPNLLCSSHKPLSLREEKLGKKQTSAINVKTKLKLEHLQNLAVWASGEASIPPLAAFFGHHLAAGNETLGLQPDPTLVSCQRCETILQPGFNCTIRIEKNQVKARRKCRKSRISTQNNVVYKCHFCSHRNLKRGTPEGHMKEINPPKAKPSLEQELRKSTLKSSVSLEKRVRSKDVVNTVDEIDVPTMAEIDVQVMDEIALPALDRDSCNSNSPVTPSVTTKITLDGKKRKRGKSRNIKSAESNINSATTNVEKVVSVSSKRRKSWTSLKEIAERSEHSNSQNITKLIIPFSL